MDTITHVLTGAVMSGPAKARLGWVGPAALLAGSFAPDADLLLELFGGGIYFKYHRVVTNSLVGVAVFSFLTAVLVWRFAEKADFKTVWALVLLSYSAHVFMDLTNSYGCKLFWPFGGRWYALDSVFILDPWITGTLIAGALLMALRVKPLPVAAVCFALLVSYWGFRIYTHSRAVDYLRSEYPEAVQVGAFPHPVNPFLWRMVTDAPGRFELGWYNLATGEWRDRAEYEKQPGNDAVRKARQAPNAKVFLDFARFPMTVSERAEGGWLVYFQDLRFSYRSGDRRFVATVKVMDDGRISEDSFKF